MQNYRFGPFPRGGNDELGFAKALIVSLGIRFGQLRKSGKNAGMPRRGCYEHPHKSRAAL